MAKKNLFGCLRRFSPQQIDLLIIALAPCRALPPEQLKRDWVRQVGLLSRRVVKRALIDAVRKGRLTFREAQEIASIIDVSLYHR